jgi:ubiquinone/menaquinone biosynthesis C-methylase UbiE
MNIYETKKFAKVWHEQTKKDILRKEMMNKIVEKALGDLEGKVVLDAGCGDGFFIPRLLKKKPQKIVGIDISKELIKIARKEIKAKNVKFYQMDLRKKMKFPDEFFDAILCYNVFQELDDISVALREFRRILKKKGKVVISITHPLYHLFVSAVETKDLPTLEALRRYRKIEAIHSTAIKGFEKLFVVYRRPISYYINEILKNNFKIVKMKEITISRKIGKLSSKHKERVGVPVFLLFQLKKS